MAEAELRAYKPSLRDMAASWFVGDTRDPVRQNLVSAIFGSRGLGPTGPSLADLSPAAPVFGVDEAQRAMDQGDYGGAAMSALSALPAGSLARLAKPVAQPAFSPQTWYHGTGNSFDTFNPWRTGQSTGAAFEAGAWLTPDPADASYWAFRSAAGPRGQASVPRRNFEQINPDRVRGANVMPMNVAPGKQKVVDGLKHYNTLKFAKEANRARLEGYDTVLFKGIDEGGGPIDQLLVLKPKTHMRSATAPKAPKPYTGRAAATASNAMAADPLGARR